MLAVYRLPREASVPNDVTIYHQKIIGENHIALPDGRHRGAQFLPRLMLRNLFRASYFLLLLPLWIYASGRKHNETSLLNIDQVFEYIQNYPDVYLSRGQLHGRIYEEAPWSVIVA